jgi:site-specific recombinase XerD
MKTLTEAINDYVSMRQGLGFKIAQVERLLKSFAAFMDAQGRSWVTSELALQWAIQPAGRQPAWWAQRLNAVRGFARYRSATDARTEIPDHGLLPHRPRRAKPYLLTEDEIGNLLVAARALKSDSGLRAQTHYCLFGLLAVTGLRISEAIALQRQDVDLQRGLLTIRGAKFGKSRLVPLHHSTRHVLEQYAKVRDTQLAHPAAGHFFVSERGQALNASTVRNTFRQLCIQIGLHAPEDRSGPRLHDYRHRFATETLLRWYRNGADIERHLPALSTFLGHSRTSDTYWYISACPELMGEAARRLQQRWEKSA